MSLVAEEVWVKIQAELKQRIPDVIFDQWFSGAEIMTCGDDRVDLGVQNRFFKSRIETAYLDVLTKAVAAAIGRPAEVSIAVSPRLLARFRKDQEMMRNENVEVSLAADNCGSDGSEAKRLWPRPVRLNPDFTFDSFIVGASNRLSHAVGLRAVERPGEYNPLYFCGQHGVGKTHLLQAICHAIVADRPDASVVYVTCEKFVDDFSVAATCKRIKEFRDYYRQCDVLVVDELQSFGVGKKVSSQSELLGLIDELIACGKQIVFGAIAPPSELDGVDAKLLGRLGAGFVDKLSLPDEATRQSLIANKMRERGIELPEAAISLMARELSGNVRRLEGTVQRLAALIEFGGMEPTVGCIRMALEVDAPGRRKSPLAYADIVRAVADEFGISPEAVTGRGRGAAIRRARQIAMVLCRRLAGGGYAELGAHFGGRSHATVISSVNKAPRELFSDGLAGRVVERVLVRLGVALKPEDLLFRQPGLFDK
ncbi:MAG: AAA family ATPase [Planctomycetota bacterium]|nr:AAA family ATPase [Planctomycetota bacterium]